MIYFALKQDQCRVLIRPVNETIKQGSLRNEIHALMSGIDIEKYDYRKIPFF